MKFVDYSTIKFASGKISLSDRFKGTLKYGFSWYGDMQAQLTVIQKLSRVLKNRFTLLQNVTLPGLDTQIPLILIGPPGIFVLIASRIDGVFRAKGEAWFEWNNRGFQPAKPNLVNRSLLMSRAFKTYMEREGLQASVIRSVIFFTHPGVYIEVIGCAARIILMDAVDRFATKLSQTQPTLDDRDVNHLIDLIAKHYRELEEAKRSKAE